MRILFAFALALLVAACIPVGARVSNLYTQAPAVQAS